MKIAEFVSHLQSWDIRLVADGERLRVNAPKGAVTDSVRAQIAERKQELLEFLRDNQSAASIPPPILRRAPGSPVPLSFAQERLWFLEQLEPGHAVYNICRSSRLTGKLRVAALEASLNEIVRRHEILRSVIRVVDCRPVQVAEPPYTLKLAVVDLQAMAEFEREREIRDRIQQMAEAPIDFAAGNFLRAELLRFEDDKHILILTTHHIVSDAWSMGILTRELWSLYETYANDGPRPLQDLSIQYADFAQWQRNWLQGEALESPLAYWKKQLNDLPILNLPTDRPRPARQSFHGARVPITLPESLSSAINELSSQCSMTPFMTLLAAFQTLLYRYSGQEDVVVGSPIAHRSRTELEPLIGFFVNTLVLRSDLSGNPTFSEVLARVREVCLGGYAHQDLPFEKLVEEMKPERDTSRNPLFQVMFALQNAPLQFSAIPGLQIQAIEMSTTRSPFDLSLFLRERDRRYIGCIEYSTDLFNRHRIERMAVHVQTLLEGIVADPKRRISKLPMLTDAERHQLLVEWNDTAADYAKNKCIHELFEEQVEGTPCAVAVSYQGNKLTYRELNARANQLANYLQKIGVGPEKLVGICMERSLDMVVGLLGILKAGGAYVPLDPTYPRERLEFMLSDAQIPILLTQPTFVEGEKWKLVLTQDDRRDDGTSRSSSLDSRIKLVCLSGDCPLISQQADENPKSGVGPENLAYVIYTSGSTGTPKGVAIEHRNTVNLLHWAKTIYGLDELAGVLASTSICFDLSVFEIFVPLTCGGKVILAENALRLHELAARQEITLINTVPSVITPVLALGPLLQSITVVNLAGEPLKAELVNRLYEEAGLHKVYDLYGPSETTTYSTFTLRHANEPETIGRPIANTQIYILDGEFQPVPMGIEGELCIGGDGVARGYLNRTELTIERFVHNPFSEDPNARLYRTGDRVRYRADGNVEFLGRNDNQVKIRGYRIELGEIEATLNQHPAVQNNVIVARARGLSGENELIGHVVLKEPMTVSIPELRNFLRVKLPAYMVPSSFVILEELPLTRNGKLDYNALPLPGGARSEPKRKFLVPQTEIEELVAQAWREVLNMENLRIYDNFFELGGHSLLAIQIVARLRKTFDREVPVSAVFNAPTVADLSVEMEKLLRDGDIPALPPIVPVPRDVPLPLSMNQEHLWRLDQMLPGTHFFNMPYVYRLTGELYISALEHALQEIIRRHEALRTVFSELNGSPFQIIKEFRDFQLPYIDLRDESTDEISQITASFILDERIRPFDLASGPLIRIKLLRLTEKDYVFLVTMHHIISDFWSMRIFRRELTVLYEAYSQGRSSALPEPLAQFADYARWERRLLETDQLRTEIDYWKERLAGKVPRLVFQKRSKRKHQAGFCTSSLHIELDRFLFTGVKILAREENCTPFMILISALTIALFVQTGQEDIRIGTLISNRDRRQTELLIGHLVNTIVLRTSVYPDMSCKQVLRQVRAVTLAGHAHQLLPFQRLSIELAHEKSQAENAPFQVLFSYQNCDLGFERLAGLTFAPFNVELAESGVNEALTTFDLIFSIRESATAFTGTVKHRADAVDATAVNVMRELFLIAVRNLIIGSAETLVSEITR